MPRIAAALPGLLTGGLVVLAIGLLLMYTRNIRAYLSKSDFNLMETLSSIDLHLAGGDYVDAEKLLLKATAHAPFEPLVMSKTLELHAMQKDKKRFFNYLLAVGETLRRDAPGLWLKALQQGKTLDPKHNLLRNV